MALVVVSVIVMGVIAIVIFLEIKVAVSVAVVFMVRMVMAVDHFSADCVAVSVKGMAFMDAVFIFAAAVFHIVMVCLIGAFEIRRLVVSCKGRRGKSECKGNNCYSHKKLLHGCSLHLLIEFV